MKKASRRILAGIVSFSLLLFMVGCANESTDTAGQTGNQAEQKIISPEDGRQLEGSGNQWGSYVDTAWLQNKSEEVIIIDVRTVEEYETVHIPGAIQVYWTDLSNSTAVMGEKGWAEILPADELGEILGKLGIDGSQDIVVYGDPKFGWGEDGRILWTLNEVGLDNVWILDGGWSQWLYNVGSFEQGAAPTSTPGTLEVDESAYDEQVDTAYVKAAEEAILLDTRSVEEYEGEATSGEARAGRIPGAVNIPYTELMNEDGTIKSVDEMKALFEASGVSADKEIITYCTGGVRAAFVTELLQMCGYENVKLYTAGFAEWAGNKANPLG